MTSTSSEVREHAPARRERQARGSGFARIALRLLFLLPALVLLPTWGTAAQSGKGVSEAVTDGIAYLRWRAGDIAGKYPEQAAAWRARADELDAIAKQGRDPYGEQKGRIVNRAYRSRLTPALQGYAVYLPPGYDPAKKWPVVVMLHGGSSNGNLFLGVVLGNNMSWLKYHEYWWNEFEPQWKPNCIVVAPDGFGQVLWRWMGERDVLDVVADVTRNYNVDEDRIALAGISNGGLGTYAIGTRHASQFSVVQAMAGAPSWFQYTGGKPSAAEQTAIRPVSALDLIENTFNTDFRFYHGRTDGGPMKPAYTEVFAAKAASLGLPVKGTWYDAGHDILYMVEKHGRSFDEVNTVVRNRHPAEVRLVTGDYRANQQHWLTATRIEHYPALSTTIAKVDAGGIVIDTQGARALTVDLRDAITDARTDVVIRVNGQEAYRGKRAPLGHAVGLVRVGEQWRTGFPREPAGTLVKRPGVSGPLTDAYVDRTVHVYGTTNPETTAALQKAAETGSKGWPIWLWNFKQEVVADTAVTDATLADANVVLYTTGDDNGLYNRVKQSLPIRIEGGAVVVGATRYEGKDVGTRFIYPNPLSPNRYVVVQAGVTTDAVQSGHRLPDFVPDYVVYNGANTRQRERLIGGAKGALAQGFFDDGWKLPGASDVTAAAAPTAPPEPASAPGSETPAPITSAALPIPAAPATPGIPATYDAPAADQAGKAARAMAKRIASFRNYRAEIPGAAWSLDASAQWRVQAQAACEARLTSLGVPWKRANEQTTPVPSPVVVTGPVGSVSFKMAHADRTLLMSCELAARLPDLARILAKHGVTSVGVISTYRDKPYTSFHTLGMALDIARFTTKDGPLSVETDFRATPGNGTCDPSLAAADGPAAKALRAIACDIAASHVFSSVLTPNYNEGHRDHMHLDARPDDPRFFLR